jgi:hypothetical protein
MVYLTDRLLSIKKLVFLAGIAAAVIIVPWTAQKVLERHRAETANRTVEIALDWSEISVYSRTRGISPEDLLARCRPNGVSGLVVDEDTLDSLIARGAAAHEPSGGFRFIDRESALSIAALLKVRYGVPSAITGTAIKPPLAPDSLAAFGKARDIPVGFNADTIRSLSAEGMDIVLRPLNAGNPEWLAAVRGTENYGFILDGKDIPGASGNERFITDLINAGNGRFIAMEFTAPLGMPFLKRTAAQRMVWGHTITPQELEKNLDAGFWIKRWIRAVRERGNRFLLVHIWPQRSVEENLRYIGKISETVTNAGFALGTAQPPAYPYSPATGRIAATAFCALLFPLAGIFLVRKIVSPSASYFAVNGITFFGGLVIASLLYDVRFMQKALQVPGIKLLMMAPLLLSGFLLVPYSRIKAFAEKDLKVKHVAVGLLLAGGAALLLMRSGNTSAGWALPDQGLRQALENLFVARPRTKEFLIGQPLLFIGFYYRKPWLIWLGMIGQVSIINTFLHAHSPVSLSMLRTGHGIWIGLLIGSLVIAAVKLIARYRKTIAGETGAPA